MNIQANLEAAKLPQLIKQSPTYKLIVPRKVEEKIRYLLRKFPHTEWSGVLFFRHEGGFETNDMVITCEDIYPMDLGNSVFTQFKMDETVTAYIADNLELFDCDMGLIHSHHSMSTTFSGTDIGTLREEGNDRNCFVSLIVNHACTYSAAVTRKLHLTKKVTVETSGVSYEFFGEGKKTLTAGVPPVEDVSEEAAIQYFMLDVEVEKVDNPLDYLDERFEEIEAKKKAAAPPKVNQKTEKLPYLANPVNDDFFDWLHSEKSAEPEKAKQGTLFDEETMEELVDPAKWSPDPTIIHYICCQMLTSSLIVNKDIDLKQWVTKHMEKKYNEIFEDMDEFERWADSMIEFAVNHYNDPDVPGELYDDWDLYMSKVTGALLDELNEYPANEYIDEYKRQLMMRAYE